MTERNYWIGVVSLEHVTWGVKGNYIQLNHGKKAPLQRLHAGDGFIYYSPRTSYPDGDPLQMFTAIGIVKTGEVYQADMGGGFLPYRLDMKFLKAKHAPIKPLIDQLSFIKDKTHWGGAFRFGQIKVPAKDFAIIAEAMGRDFEKDFASR